MKINLAFLFACFHGSTQAQSDDSLNITIHQTVFKQGDTIDFEANLKNHAKVSNAATIYLWLQNIKTGQKWHYRFPLINGYLHSQLIIDNKIQDGVYALNFILRKDFFTLKGQLQNETNKQNILSYFLLTKNKATSTDIITLNDTQSFALNGLLFQDSAFIIFSDPLKKKNKPQIKFQSPLDSSYTPYQTVIKYIKVSSTIDSAIINKPIDVKNDYVLDSSIFKKILPPVIVISKTKKLIDDFAKDYVSGLFRNDNAITIDGLESNEIASSTNLFSFLASKAPGITVEMDETGVEYFKWRNHHTAIYIDEIKVEPETLSNLSPADIAMIKIFNPGTPVSFGSGEGGTIAVYTKVGSYSKPDKISNSITVAGYDDLQNIWK